jgi:hypothetical protein
MADHGKNRKRSYYARKRQSRGKYKVAMHDKLVKKLKRFWYNYWHAPLPEMGNNDESKTT